MRIKEGGKKGGTLGLAPITLPLNQQALLSRIANYNKNTTKFF
jgi:hypothetical protein